MNLTPLHHAVLNVLKSQSPGYLIDPSSSAFVAIGLDDPKRVRKAIKELEEGGYVSHRRNIAEHSAIRLKRFDNGQLDTDNEDRPQIVLDEQGDPVWDTVDVVEDEGWVIEPLGTDTP